MISRSLELAEERFKLVKDGYDVDPEGLTGPRWGTRIHSGLFVSLHGGLRLY